MALCRRRVAPSLLHRSSLTLLLLILLLVLLQSAAAHRKPGSRTHRTVKVTTQSPSPRTDPSQADPAALHAVHQALADLGTVESDSSVYLTGDPDIDGPDAQSASHMHQSAPSASSPASPSPPASHPPSASSPLPAPWWSAWAYPLAGVAAVASLSLGYAYHRYRASRRARLSASEFHTRPLLVQLSAPRGRVQGSEWATQALKWDEDGDAAHDFLGPFTFHQPTRDGDTGERQSASAEVAAPNEQPQPEPDPNSRAGRALRRRRKE